MSVVLLCTICCGRVTADEIVTEEGQHVAGSMDIVAGEANSFVALVEVERVARRMVIVTLLPGSGAKEVVDGVVISEDRAGTTLALQRACDMVQHVVDEEIVRTREIAGDSISFRSGIGAVEVAILDRNVSRLVGFDVFGDAIVVIQRANIADPVIRGIYKLNAHSVDTASVRATMIQRQAFNSDANDRKTSREPRLGRLAAGPVRSVDCRRNANRVAADGLDSDLLELTSSWTSTHGALLTASIRSGRADEDVAGVRGVVLLVKNNEASDLQIGKAAGGSGAQCDGGRSLGVASGPIGYVAGAAVPVAMICVVDADVGCQSVAASVRSKGDKRLVGPGTAQSNVVGVVEEYLAAKAVVSSAKEDNLISGTTGNRGVYRGEGSTRTQRGTDCGAIGNCTGTCLRPVNCSSRVNDARPLLSAGQDRDAQHQKYERDTKRTESQVSSSLCDNEKGSDRQPNRAMNEPRLPSVFHGLYTQILSVTFF